MTDEKQGWGQRLFINRDFGLLFWGRLVSQIGDGIHYLALTWLVLDLTGSGTALGTMLLASSLPSVALAPFTGVLADLWDRKTIVVSMDILRGLLLVGLALIFRAGQLTMPILYAGTALLSLCGVLFGPAISAAIPSLVKKEELVKANSLNNFSRAATMILGPVMGALLLATTGYFGVFLVNGIAFLLSALSEMFIRFPPVIAVRGEQAGQTKAGRQFVRSLQEGFGYIWENRGLKVLIVFALAINFLAAPIFNVILPFFGKEILGLGAEQFGTIQASIPVGFLIGTATVGFLTKKHGKRTLLTWGVAGQGFISIIFGLFALPVFYRSVSISVIMGGAIIVLLISGIFNTLVNVPLQVLLQETVPDGYRGRVYGLFDSLAQLLVPISTALSGVLVDNVSVAGLMGGIGLMIFFLGLGMGASPGIKRLYQEEPGI